LKINPKENRQWWIISLIETQRITSEYLLQE
jgi:hypothetical protein